MQSLLRKQQHMAASFYIKWGLIICLAYIFCNGFGAIFTKFDFLIVCYLLMQVEIDSENSIYIALLFGIFYDLFYPLYFGVGILLFLVLNFIKTKGYLMIDMSMWYLRLLFSIFIIVIYTAVTLRAFDYPLMGYLYSLGYYTLTDTIAFLVITLILGVTGGLSHSKG